MQIAREVKLDSIQGNIMQLYIYSAKGEPIDDFTGHVITDNGRKKIIHSHGNLYSIEFDQSPRSIIITDTNSIYGDCNLDLDFGTDQGNAFSVYLFLRNELQKNKWILRYHNEKLLYKGLEFTKMTIK